PYVFFELHEKAPVAHVHVKRIERFHAVELIEGHEAFAQRRHAEVDDRVFEPVRAEATHRRARDRIGRRRPRTRVHRFSHTRRPTLTATVRRPSTGPWWSRTLYRSLRGAR